LSWDAIVIGGGPAGATTAALLAQYGHTVLVLEHAKFPRHHIGESLMPETYWTFQRLGMLETLQRSAFPRKESVQFISASGAESQPFFFTDRDPNEWSVTWQVRRDEFDRMMLDNAHRLGAEVREGVRVREVLFEGDAAVGVAAQQNGRREELRSKIIVDATGVAGLLSRQLNLRQRDPKLRNGAIYAYFKNARRGEGRNAGATLVIYTPNGEGWFWFIPLPDEVTSIGIVAPPEYLFTGRGDDPLATLEEEIAACPALARRLTEATRVTGAYVTSDFSYRSRRLAGHGWVMVGDAFCFLDPIYSSGLMFALRGGELAADAIHDALEAKDYSDRILGRFAHELSAGIHRIRQLVYAFYTKEFSFAEFIRNHPEEHDHLVRLLIGDAFNEDVESVFEPMSRWVDLPAAIHVEQAPAPGGVPAARGVQRGSSQRPAGAEVVRTP
jgi:flavin-dependent dehydrogenase